jgi:predicted Fe-Mo cluster-binding NifX family protein
VEPVRILITISGNNVSPRFDLTNEVLIVDCPAQETAAKPRSILLPRSSAEELCSLILKENITTVICGGIEENHYKYLNWKKIKVIDSVIGPYREALDLARTDHLPARTILPGAATKVVSP